MRGGEAGGPGGGWVRRHHHTAVVILDIPMLTTQYMGSSNENDEMFQLEYNKKLIISVDSFFCPEYLGSEYCSSA